MAVLTRSALESSPLADLHEIASELGIDGFRRLRKAELVEAILGRQDPTGSRAAERRRPRPPRPSRARRGRGRDADARAPRSSPPPARALVPRRRPTRSRTRRRRRRTRTTTRRPAAPAAAGAAVGAACATRDPGEDGAARRPQERPRGPGRATRPPRASSTCSATARASCASRRPDPSDGDVYISAAQVRRCELVDGDTVTGPVRAPRRSERYPSLVRVDTINGRPADEVAEGTPFEELPAALPTERFALGGDDPTLGAIVHLTPIGKGSRVTIAGPAFAGKSEALRRLAAALHGARGRRRERRARRRAPEELARLGRDGIEPAVSLSFAASADARGPGGRARGGRRTPPGGARRPRRPAHRHARRAARLTPRARRSARRARSPTAAR